VQVFVNLDVKLTNSQNMNCKNYQKHILSYLDGELHQDLADELEKHIASCARCKVEVERLEMVDSLINVEKSEFKPDPFMSSRVLAKLNRSNISTSNNNLSLRYLTITSLAAAGIAIGILIGTLYSTYTSPENTSVNQDWDQLADEYMPEVENNPYNMVTITNEIPQKP
jgi:anti-sigma factor RsiW